MTKKDNCNEQGAMNGNGGQNDSNFILEIPRTDCGISLSSDALSDVPSEVIIKTRIQYGDRWSACKGLLSEYAKSTSIHGVRYLFEVHRPIYEKVFWLVALSVSLYIGISLSRDTYRKWQDSPVILAFDDTLVPVHEIPFPTVTICMEVPQIEFEPKGYEQMPKDAYEKYLQDQSDRLWYASFRICDKGVEVKGSWTPNETSDPFWYFGWTGKWNGRTYKSYRILLPFDTDEGVCKQFNGMPRSYMYRIGRNDRYPTNAKKLMEFMDFNKYLEDNLTPLNNITGNWTLEDGYVGQGFNARPQRTIYSSIDKGFIASVDRQRNDEVDPKCRFGQNGYKIFLNSPDSVPQTSGNFIRVSDGEEVIISLIPQYVRSTDDVRDYEPRKRQCYFNDERYLRFFRYYSQSNCETECRINFTIAKCGCAEYWIPGPKNLPGCGVMGHLCYLNARTELNLILQNQTLQAKRNPVIMCDCMPACTSLDYNYEISRAPYDKRKLKGVMRQFYPYEKGTVFKIFFKERQFIAIKRTVLFSVTSLIANYGGFCGLLMGISGLSLIELVYFVSLRLCNSLRKRRVSKKKLERKRKKLAMQQILATAGSSSHSARLSPHHLTTSLKNEKCITPTVKG